MSTKLGVPTTYLWHMHMHMRLLQELVLRLLPQQERLGESVGDVSALLHNVPPCSL